MNSRWILFASLCLAAAPVFAEPESRGTLPELAAVLTNAPRTALVTGEAELKVQADRGIITVKISNSARELGQALRANEETRAKFINSLVAKGIAADQVQASKFSSTEKYGIFSEKAKSHRVNNLLKVTVKSGHEFQAVADTIDNLPEAQYISAEFERSDKEQLREKAIAEACDNAMQRKKVFEERLGVKLMVRRFFDPSATFWYGESAGTATSGARGYGFYLPVDSGVSLAPPADYSDRVTTRALAQRAEEGTGFGELVFRSRVTVEYTVEGK